MEESPCSKLIKILKETYTVEQLDEFLSAAQGQNDPPYFQISISTKGTENQLATLVTSIEHDYRQIFIGDVRRTNTLNATSKGLGEALLYIVVCKAIELGYTVAFAASGPELYPYYNSRGFQRNVGTSDYTTRPTAENFHPRVEKTVERMKKSSTMGGKRLKRKALRTRRRQRGGADIIFKVLVFSDGPLSSDTKQSIQDVLTELYGQAKVEEVEHSLKQDFLDTTGLGGLLNARNKFQTQFQIENPPHFLQKKMNPDTLLTALEGQIQNKLEEKQIDVSLIPPQHGLYGDYGELKMFYVGLCSPACKTYAKNMYKYEIQKATA